MEHPVQTPERRKHGRVQLSKQVDVAVLGEGHECMMGKIFEESKRGLGLRLPSAVAAGTPIKIESGDRLILGEVSGCTREDYGFRVGVIVKHRLPGLAELHRLNRALYGETQSVSAIMER